MRQKLLKLGLLISLLVLVVHTTPSSGQESDVRILVDDFEVVTDWWSYEAGSLFFDCHVTNTGYESNNALEITFNIGRTGSPGCGYDLFIADPFWGNTEGLEFMWRADLSYMAVQVIVRMRDFTQINPDAGGLTDFEAYMLTAGDTWSMGQVAWVDFAKSDWVGESGVDILDPNSIEVILFSVAEWERGTVWIDDLYAVENLTELTSEVNEVASPETP